MHSLSLPTPEASPGARAIARARPASSGLTVSIVSHRQAALVDPLLRQLAAQVRPGLVDRVVLTINLPESLPDDWRGLGLPLELRHNREPAGFAANHNRALHDCDSATVAVLNPDLRLQGDPLSPLHEAAIEPGVGLAAPEVFESDGRLADAARGLLTPASVLSRTLLRRREASDTPAWYAGMCLVLPLSAWRAVGGFDEAFRMYCEDFDLCARLRLAGLRLVQVRGARVLHAAQRSSHRAWRPMLWHTASLLRVWRSTVYRDYRRLLRAERSAALSGCAGQG